MEARKIIRPYLQPTHSPGVYCRECGQSAIACGGTHGQSGTPPLRTDSGWTIAGLPDEDVVEEFSTPLIGDAGVPEDGGTHDGGRGRHPPIVVEGTASARQSIDHDGEVGDDPSDAEVTGQTSTTLPPQPPFSSPGTGSSKRGRRTRRTRGKKLTLRRVALIAVFPLAAIAVCLLVVLVQVSPPPQVTIRITPLQRVLQQVEHVDAVLSVPGAQVGMARLIRGSASPQTAVAHASGRGFTQPISAQGSLTLTNESSSWQTVRAGSSYTTSSGVTVVTDADVQVPPVDLSGSTPVLGKAVVPAHSLKGGAVTNIPAHAIDACCTAGVAVRNLAAFSGGRDGQPYPILRSSDIQEAAAPLLQKQVPRVTGNVLAQRTAAERFVEAPSCTPEVHADQGDGARTASTAVQVTVTCTGEVYRVDQVEALAWRHLQDSPSPNAQITSELRTSYSPTRTGTKVLRAAVSNVAEGKITLTVWVQGVWVHQVRPEVRTWMRKHLAGKSKNVAQAVLSPAQGIEHASISWVPNGQIAFPSDPEQITILVIQPNIQHTPPD